MMRVLFTFLFIAITTTAFAQYPDITYESKSIRAKAKKITQAYDKQLGLDGKQYPIFLDKIEDYLVLANKAKENLKGKEELDALTKLMANQALDMQELLTRPQYNLYKRIWQDIQPIKVLKSN